MNRKHFEETGKPYVRRAVTEAWMLATQDESDVYLHKYCYQEAIKHLDEQLGQGIPVMVGIDWRNGNINYDKITDHWVVITARRQDAQGVYYTYLETAQRENGDESPSILEDKYKRGTSTDENRFYFDETGTYLIGAKPTTNLNRGDKPIVTIIRGTTSDSRCRGSMYTREDSMENANRAKKEKSSGELIKIHSKKDYKFNPSNN